MAFVYVLQHHEAETLGTLGDALRTRRIATRTIAGFAGETVPQHLGGAAGLVILGGPMSVSEQELYPFLRDEVALIKDALAHNAPILGICLGGQLLAHALGAAVTKATRSEIGWSPLRLTDAARQDRLWAGIDSPCSAFHWHEDAFDLPPGSVALASSDLTLCQAFRFGSCAYGLQCHLEVTLPLIEDWLAVWGKGLPNAEAAADAIRAQAPQELPRLGRTAQTVFGAWIDMLTP